MPNPPRGARAPLWPYRVLVSLLYQRFDWITRTPGGGLSVPTGRFAATLGLRTPRLRAYLVRLQDLGYITSLAWYRGSFFCRVTHPGGPSD